ncbi:MAG: alpha/beta hydrolase [bacterium]|nr:alpha/beta hydrolase [bacterium]
MIYRDNNKKQDLVLIPGWATDYTIFGENFLTTFAQEYNFIFLEIKDLEQPFLVIDEIQDFLNNKRPWLLKRLPSKKANLLGWSMGATLAADYARKFGANKLFLYGIRRQYPKHEIRMIKRLLNKSIPNYLNQFYKLAAADELTKSYSHKFSLNFLMNGLEYLEKTEFKCDFLNKIKILKITNALDDKIATFKDFPDIPNTNRVTKFFINDAGHFCGIRK